MANLTVKLHKVQLNGNEMSGDTYPVKQWIKTYLNGKWNAERKVWIVDLGQVTMWTGTCIQPDNTPAQSKNTGYNNPHYNGICPRCHSYCDGDCTAH